VIRPVSLNGRHVEPERVEIRDAMGMVLGMVSAIAALMRLDR
jgi:hypothetical protein